jgi:TorA maturation chaperone TorD
MDESKITSLTPLFLRFYARCFVYPYAEQQYELQHLFRVMENEPVSDEETEHLETILSIINQYQGQEIKILREDFVATFTNTYSEQNFCSLLAGDFTSRHNIQYDPESLLDLYLENGLTVEADESFDSIINYLEYLSMSYEQFLAGEIDLVNLDEFVSGHILNWIPLFCLQVQQQSNLEFYKEAATGLRFLLLWLNL